MNGADTQREFVILSLFLLMHTIKFVIFPHQIVLFRIDEEKSGGDGCKIKRKNP